MATKIKICGITNIADGLAACDAGASAVGFIAVPASKRFVTVEQYRTIVLALPPFVVPVVVAETIDQALAYDPVCIQYYGGPDSGPSGIPLIRAFRPRTSADLAELRTIDNHEVRAFLLDAYHPDMLGGAGATFDWRLFEQAATTTTRPLILSGGLTPSNVAAAIVQTHPYAVDVSTGVEVSPGVKDHAKVAAFIAAVRAARVSRPDIFEEPR